MADVLVVYVLGLTEKVKRSAPLLARVRDELGLAEEDTWVYPNPVRPLTRGRLAKHAHTLSASIQQYWERRGRPDRIVLIGHSIGGLLVRYAYLAALGSLGGQKLDWATHLRRIVLLAAPNRGWEVRRMPVPSRVVTAMILPFARWFAARDVLTGSPFVTGMRLEWLREIGTRGTSAPEVVQVRAGKDLVVEPEDSRDLESLPTGVQLLLPPATHADIPCVSGVAEDFPGQRWQVLRQAILGDVEPTSPTPLTEKENRYRSVVFVLHGIRSNNDGWVEQLSGLLAADGTVRVVPGSYGRFSAYNFAVPITRRRTLRWFLDQYSYHLARHPDLPFHFVGHSNGTYMLGQSLRHVRSVRFQRVYLAGSVLPRDFDWQARTDQVTTLVNVCATKDKPVAWLCSALRGIGMRDIGLGGYSGFETVPDASSQFRYLAGGHGVALAPERLPGIAGFLRTGRPVTPDGLVGAQPRLFGLISRLAEPLARLVGLAWLVLAVLGVMWADPVMLGLLVGVPIVVGFGLKFV